MITIFAAIDAIEDETERILLTRLYETYAGMIFGYIKKKFFFSDEDAEDALIDIFHKIILHRKTFIEIDEKEEFRKIIIITRSVCINAWKRRQLEQKYFVSSDIPMENDEGEPFVQEYADARNFTDDIIQTEADADAIKRVFQILQTMPPPVYEIFLMKYIYNLSNVQIAQELTMNASTVGTVVQRTIEKIRKELGDDIL